MNTMTAPVNTNDNRGFPTFSVTSEGEGDDTTWGVDCTHAPEGLTGICCSGTAGLTLLKEAAKYADEERAEGFNAAIQSLRVDRQNPPLSLHYEIVAVTEGFAVYCREIETLGGPFGDLLLASENMVKHALAIIGAVEAAYIAEAVVTICPPEQARAIAKAFSKFSKQNRKNVKN